MTQAFVVQTELGHLSAAISGGATSIVLVGGEGASFDTDLPYDIMIGGEGGEVVSLTAIATDTLTVSATAGAWPEGTAVFMVATLSQPRTSGQIALVSDIASAGGGDVSGPGSSIDRAIPSWNGTGGTTLRSNSAPIIASDWRITSLTDPTGAQDAATKAYVDAQTGIAGGSDPQVQWNSGGNLDGAARLLIDADGLPTVGELTATNPSAPAAGSTIASLYRAGFNELVSIGQRGGVQRYAQNQLSNPCGWLFQAGSSVTVDGVGIIAPTLVSSSTSAITVADTNFLTQQRRYRITSNTVAAGNGAGWRSAMANPIWLYSTNTGVGGFRAQVKFIIHQSRTNQRAFVGFHNSNSATILANDPSSFTDVAGFAVDAGQTNWRWITNDAAGTATSTDLGSTYDTASNDTYLYILTIYCPPGGGAIYYSAERYDTSGNLSFTDGVSTSNLPTSGSTLNFYLLLALGTTTGSAVSIEPCSATFTTEY